MKTSVTSIGSLVALIVSFVLFGHSPASAIGVGDKAPDFELESTKGGKVKLSTLRGKTVLLNFYVFDFSTT